MVNRAWSSLTRAIRSHWSSITLVLFNYLTNNILNSIGIILVFKSPNMQPDTIRGVLCVLGGLIMHLYLGCFYLWGNVQVYITSYLNKHDGPVSLDDTGIVFVIQTISQALFMPMSPFLMKYIPPWACCIIGGCISIGGVFIASFAKSYILFVCLYPTLFGIGVGFCYMAPIISGWEYFPNNKGLVSGLIVLGFGFGSFIFGFISLAVANPDNIDPDYKSEGGNIFDPNSPISERAPKMIRINCAIWVGLLTIAVLMIRRKQKPKTPDALLNTHDDLNQNSRGSIDASSALMPKGRIEIVEPTFKEAILDYRVLQIWAMMVLTSSFPLYIASNFKTYEQRDVHDDKFITIVGSVGAVFNGVSRGFWSTLQDKLGFKLVYMALLTLEAGIAFTFVLIHKVKALYLIWVCCSFTCLGGHFSIFPTLCAKIFGPTTGGKIYTVLFSAFASATIINFILTKQSSKGHIEYEVLFYILASMIILSFISAIFLKDATKVRTKAQNDSSMDSSQNKIS